MSDYENLILKKYEKLQNWEQVAEWFESKYSIGLQIETDGKKKIIYNTERPIKLVLRIITTTERRFIQEKIKNENGVYVDGNLLRTGIIYYENGKPTLPKNLKVCDRFAIVDKVSNVAYTEGEILQPEDILNDETIIKIEYEKKIDDIQKEYEERYNGIRQIMKQFKIQPFPALYKESILCRELFKQANSHLHGCEYVEDSELPFLEGSMRGQMTYIDNGAIINDCIKYDINSQYMDMMTSKGFKIPLTVGKICTIEEITDTDITAIYKLKVHGENILWKDSDNDYYTNYHVKILSRLNIDYELVQEEDNAIIWEHCITGDKLFSYLHDLYELKKKGNKYAKAVINTTWGQLSRHSEIWLPLSKYDPDKDRLRVKDWNFEKDLVLLRPTTGKGEFKYITGRIKTFILSYTRYRFIKDYLQPTLKAGYNIHLVNTDAFLTNAPAEVVEKFGKGIGQECGQLKIEATYTGKHKVVNIRKIEKL
jgi:hypothetical protein